MISSPAASPPRARQQGEAGRLDAWMPDMMVDTSALGERPRREAPGRSQRLWIDLTTLRQHRFGNPVGLTRVERNLASACGQLLGADVGFFAHDRNLRRFVALARETADALLSSVPRRRSRPATACCSSASCGRATRRPCAHGCRRTACA
jgi:hypothetical protein